MIINSQRTYGDAGIIGAITGAISPITTLIDDLAHPELATARAQAAAATARAQEDIALGKDKMSTRKTLILAGGGLAALMVLMFGMSLMGGRRHQMSGYRRKGHRRVRRSRR